MKCTLHKNKELLNTIKEDLAQDHKKMAADETRKLIIELACRMMRTVLL
jgi:hypothetical protein